MYDLLEIPYRITAAGRSIAHLLLAIGVTGHVLLYKRDVSTFIGWIGPAGLSPILGSILCVIFGINRVKRRADQLRDRRTDRHVAEPPPQNDDR